MRHSRKLAIIAYISITAPAYEGCREAPPPLIDAQEPLDSAPSSCQPQPPAAPAAQWTTEVVWDHTVSTTTDGNVVGIIRTPGTILTFLSRTMVRTSDTGENPVELPYQEGTSYEHVVQGPESAVALINRAEGDFGHRLCLLSLAGALDLTSCVKLPYSPPIPFAPLWNGEHFQVLTSTADNLVLRQMTSDGVLIEDEILAPIPPTLTLYDATPLGASQLLTMRGVDLSRTRCHMGWWQRAQDTTLHLLGPEDRPIIRLWKAHSESEVFVVHSSSCAQDPLICSRTEGDASFYSSRIAKDGSIITELLPEEVYGTTELFWDAQSFVAITAASNRLTAYVFGSDSPLEGVAAIPSADVSNHPIALALAPRDYLVAFKALQGGHRLMRIKVHP